MQAEAGRLPVPFQGMLNDLLGHGVVEGGGGNAAGTSGRARRRRHRLVLQPGDRGALSVTRGSNRDVASGDFAQLFAPGGMMDDFFQKNLVTQVDTSVNPWAFKRGVDGSAAGRSAYLDSFQKAQAIRDVFFSGMAGGRTPSFTIDIRPEDMDAALTQFTLDVDGQTVRYAHGPQAPSTIKWPGPRNSSTRCGLQVTTANGTPAGGIVTEEAVGAAPAVRQGLDLRRAARPNRSTPASTCRARRSVLAGDERNSVYNPLLPQMNGFFAPGEILK